MRLIEARDRHFSWMLGETKGIGILRLPPGGVSEHAIVAMLRNEAAKLRVAGCRGYWMAVVGQDVVGLCGYKRLPDEDGVVDFGYGIAPHCQGRGYGTALVAALVARAARQAPVRALIAETAVDNIASQRVLERNGFVREGGRLDHDDGPLLIWRRTIRKPVRPFAVFREKKHPRKEALRG